MAELSPNRRAWRLAQTVIERADELGARVHRTPAGAVAVDCGVEAQGGIELGLLLARLCMGDLGSAQIAPMLLGEIPMPHIAVFTDHPLLACMGSQYAGWEIRVGKFFAMGSGPIRLLAKKEKLLAEYGLTDDADVAVAVLESSHIPSDEVVAYLAESAGVQPTALALFVARTASVAGTIQVVARSVETCLHKMHELGLDLRDVTAGFGTAPLPPLAANDLEAIGRTNDAILYGAHVTLWTNFPPEIIAERGPEIPSSSSRDFGLLFRELFDRAGGNFYEIDPHIFSPAHVTLYNRVDGKRYSFGQVYPDVCWKSF